MSTAQDDHHGLTLDSFIYLADTLAGDYEVNELLQFLVDRARQILGAGTAGVLLEGGAGSLQLAAATSEEMEVIERVEINSKEGPCIDAYMTRQAVVVSDLDAVSDRWPRVVPRLREMGMASGVAFPIKLRDDCIGALNLYRHETGTFADEHLRLGQAFADIAAIGILQQRRIAEANERTEQLQRALTSRIIIEQAKGVVVANEGVSPAEAFDRIRRYARREQIRIHDLSEDIVAGTVPDRLD